MRLVPAIVALTLGLVASACQSSGSGAPTGPSPPTESSGTPKSVAQPQRPDAAVRAHPFRIALKESQKGWPRRVPADVKYYDHSVPKGSDGKCPPSTGACGDLCCKTSPQHPLICSSSSQAKCGGYCPDPSFPDRCGRSYCCESGGCLDVPGYCAATCDGAEYPVVCGHACCSATSKCNDGVCTFTSCPDHHPVACDDYCCKSGWTCEAGVCTPPQPSAVCADDYPVVCGDMCCADGATCEDANESRCGCPPSFAIACGPDHCCEADACPDTAPVACGDACCLPGAQCVDGECGCPKSDPQKCDTVCCADDSACVEGQCTIPGTTALCPNEPYILECGDACCARGAFCSNRVDCSCRDNLVDCGDYCCPSTAQCGDNGGCLGCPAEAPVECGSGCCPAGTTCRDNALCVKPPASSGGNCPAGQCALRVCYASGCPISGCHTQCAAGAICNRAVGRGQSCISNSGQVLPCTGGLTCRVTRCDSDGLPAQNSCQP